MQIKYNRKSIRLHKYDYTSPGMYFVTICTHNKKCFFGDIIDGEIKLNKLGEFVQHEWIKTEKLRPNITLDKYVVMPNHFHGILHIGSARTGTARRAPTIEQYGKPVPESLPTIIRSFKSAATKQINQLHNTPGKPIWQRNYYEHIIRNENSLNKIREYIINNPIKWQFDHYNPGDMK
jgi:putative transposase